MRRLLLVWVCVALAALSALLPCAADIVDPGFESTTLNWNPWGADTQGQGTWVLDTANPHSGAKCAKASASGFGAVYEQALLQYHGTGTGLVPLLPNTTYKLSFWVRNADTLGTQWQGALGSWTDSWAKHMVFLYNSAGQYAGFSGELCWIGTPLPQWTLMEADFATTPDTAYGYLILKCHLNRTVNGESNIWYDDVSIVRSEPTVNNIGFDNSTWAPWTPDGGGGLTWSISSSNPHRGNTCALATGGSSSAYEGKLQWGDKPVYADTDYRFSIWVRNTGGNWGAYGGSYSQSWFKVVALEADGSGNFGALGSHDLTPIQSSIAGWTRLVSDFATSPTTTQVRIIIKGHLASPSNTIAFDDVAFTVARARRVSWTPFDIPSMRKGLTAGADVVGIPIKDFYGAFYPSTVSAPHATYGNGSIVYRALELAHDSEALFVGGFPPTMEVNILTLHPEWRIRYTDSTSWLTAPADQARGCLVSPYGDYLISEMVELAQTVGVDGVSYDGYQNPTFCYCDYCKAKFLADTGYSIPASVNYDSATYRRWLLWQDAQIIDHLARMRAAVQAVYPKFEFYIWSTNAGRYGHYLTSPRVMPTELHTLFDCSMQEWWADESNIGLSVIPDFGTKYLGAVSRGTQWFSDPYLFTHAKDLGPGPYASSMPELEIRFRTFSAIAGGSSFNFDASTTKSHMIDSLFAELEARRPWTHKAVSMPWAAIVVSEPTRQFYGRNDAVNLYMSNCFGYYAALMEYHIPVDLITHTDLRNGLASNYRVLILPNMACMSSADIAAVQSFVSAGGGLVATGATSMYDEEGVSRSGYALQDLLKVRQRSSKISVQARVTIGETLFGRNSVELGKLLSPTGRTTSFAGEVFPVYIQSGGLGLGTVCSTSTCTTSYPLYVTNTSSAGRVAYFPACLDAGYFKSPYPYEAVLLKDAVMWAANATPPITIVGPRDLQVTYYTQKNGKRLVVHLLNARLSSAGQALAANDIPVRDEILPIRNIEVWFESAVPTSAKLQPENLSLPIDVQGSRARLVVSELRQHSMVVADIP